MRSNTIIRLKRTAIIAGLIVLGGLPAAAQRDDDSSRASKNGKLEGQIEDVAVVVEYGRPNVKGREIWGGLVPFGSVWRTGADEATTITFSADVAVEGQSLPAGTYSLFTVPGPDGWEVIFNSVAKQWGAFNYEAGKDVLRVKAQPRSGEFVESLEFVLDGSELVLRWEKLELPVTIAGG